MLHVATIIMQWYRMYLHDVGLARADEADPLDVGQRRPLLPVAARVEAASSAAVLRGR